MVMMFDNMPTIDDCFVHPFSKGLLVIIPKTQVNPHERDKGLAYHVVLVSVDSLTTLQEGWPRGDEDQSSSNQDLVS